jgi:hypothetical protein
MKLNCAWKEPAHEPEAQAKDHGLLARQACTLERRYVKAPNFRRFHAIALAAILMLSNAASSLAEGCYLGRMLPATLRDDAQSAHVVMICFVEQNRQSADSNNAESALRVIDVFKNDSQWRRQERIRIDRFIDISSDKPLQAYLIFAEVTEGKLDPYRATAIDAVALDAVSAYLRSVLKFADKQVSARLAYQFRHLDSTVRPIADDAMLEFQKLPEPELIQAGKKLDAGKLRRLIADPITRKGAVGDLMLLLAGCGTKDDALLIRRLQNPEEYKPLIALTMLAPELGFAEIHSRVINPKLHFLNRYAGLRALRFLSKNPVEPIDRASVLGAIAMLLDQADLADFAVEDLRKLECWDYMGKAVEVAKKFDVPIVRRAVLRYALSAPFSNKPAVEYRERVRLTDPDQYADAVELLQLETKESPPKP